MLFADVVGYSQLTEEQNPLFVEHFLGGVSSVMTQSGDRPVTRNTWGDALYFVFDSVAKAGRLALELVDLMHTTDWIRLGLPADLNLRVALHAGPVFECRDPVVGRRSFTGSHVNQAARIEPVTPPAAGPKVTVAMPWLRSTTSFAPRGRRDQSGRTNSS